jgi:hypothetical protein
VPINGLLPVVSFEELAPGDDHPGQAKLFDCASTKIVNIRAIDMGTVFPEDIPLPWIVTLLSAVIPAKTRILRNISSLSVSP